MHLNICFFIINNVNLSNFDINKIPTLKSTWKVHENSLNWFESYFPYSTTNYLNIKNKINKLNYYFIFSYILILHNSNLCI